MFPLIRDSRKAFAAIMAAMLLWSVGAEAYSDWVEHERSHAVALADVDELGRPAHGPVAEHDKGCHGSHHLQAHLAASFLVPAISTALPRPVSPPVAGHESAPDLPYHPPRFTIPA